MDTHDDPYNLQRFVEAQNTVYAQVCAELRSGRKSSHWIWFIFPQLCGLGYSAMSDKFSISGLAEAQAYLQHPLLGARLRACSRLVSLIEGKTIRQIFGAPDDMKFRSSMTLFACAAPDQHIFEEVLHQYFSGEKDKLTLARLAGE